MTTTMREAAREAAKLLWAADEYRLRGERNSHLRDSAERIAEQLEQLAASTLCGDVSRQSI
ncbi:MAG: hypothetical protein AAFO01_18990 [Pseudomonadota bacterium]